MAEGIAELVGSAFHLREDTFDAIAIPMGFMLESEPKPMECSVKLRSLIDQKHGIVDVMFLAEFLQEFHGDWRRLAGKQLVVKQVVRGWINRSIQPESPVVQLNHCLVNRDMIRGRTRTGL